MHSSDKWSCVSIGHREAILETYQCYYLNVWPVIPTTQSTETNRLFRSKMLTLRGGLLVDKIESQRYLHTPAEGRHDMFSK